jgi:DNA-binding MarR family transcriptional regulator
VLAEDLLDELDAWGPRERVRMFRHWHQGAFSLIHLMVLTTIEAEGPRSMGGIAEALDVSVASTTGIVDRMERRGLVERSQATADRRVVIVRLTDRGRAVVQEVDARRRQRLQSVVARLTVRQRAGLLAGMRAMRRAAEELRAEQSAPHGASSSDPGPVLSGHAAGGRP